MNVVDSLVIGDRDEIRWIGERIFRFSFILLGYKYWELCLGDDPKKGLLIPLRFDFRKIL